MYCASNQFRCVQKVHAQLSDINILVQFIRWFRILYDSHQYKDIKMFFELSNTTKELNTSASKL